MALGEFGSACLRPGCGPITPLGWPQVFTSWKLDPPMLVLLVSVVAAYSVGVRYHQRRIGPWPWGRTLHFAAATVVFGLATMSVIGAYSLVLFWDRCVQNALLFMTVPMLFACSAPVTLLVSTSGRFGAWLGRIIESRPLRIATFPAFVSLIILVTPYLLFFTGWYRLTLTSTFFDESLHVELMAIGFLYFWTRIRVDPVPRAYPHLISVWISAVEGVGDAGVAILLWLGNTLVAAHYYASLSTLPHETLYAPLMSGTESGLAWNQAVGGGLFMVLCDLTSLPLIGALWRGLRREEVLAADVAQENLEVVAVEYSPGEGIPQERYRPWWETDAELAARYGGGPAAE